MATNGFIDLSAGASAFNELDVQQVDIPKEAPVAEATKQAASLALLREQELPESFQNRLMQLEDMIGVARELTDGYAESQLRNRLAIKQIEGEASAIQSIYGEVRNNPTVSPDVTEAIRNAYAHTIATSVEQRAKYAIEKAAADEMIELAASGDEIQARLIQSKLAGTGDVMKITSDYLTKRMLLAREIEKAGVAVEEQGTFSYIVDRLLDILPADWENFRYRISKDETGLDFTTRFMDFITPMARVRRQGGALMSLSLDEFVDRLPAVVQAIRDRGSTLGKYDPQEVLEVLQSLEGIDSRSEFWGDFWGVANIVTIPSLSAYKRMGTLTFNLASAGGRKQAAGQLAHALNKVDELGTVDVSKQTGMTADQIADELLPSSVNPNAVEPNVLVSYGVDAQDVNRVAEALRIELPIARLREDELQLAINTKIDELTERYGRVLKDAIPARKELADGSHVFGIDFMLGKKNGGGFADAANARAQARKLGIGNPEVIQDSSGQWFIKHHVAVGEEGFTKIHTLNVPKQGPLSKLAGSSQQSDFNLFGAATSSGNNMRLVQKKIDKNFTEAFRKLNKEERSALTGILAKGQEEARWYSKQDFDVLYTRQTGKAPSQKAYDAYTQYIVNNDAEHIIRNALLYKEKHLKGMETINLRVGNRSLDFDGNIYTDMRHYPNGRVFDMEQGAVLTTKPDNLEELKKQGYMIVKPERPVTLEDGTTVTAFLSKRGKFRTQPLRMNQLEYRAGGHRHYVNQNFVKQASYGTQPDGEKFLKNANTFISTPALVDAQKWADVMNKARLAAKQGASAGDIDAIFDASSLKFPTGQEFLDKVNAGLIDLDAPFEAVRNRQLPSVYNRNKSPYVVDESPAESYYGTTGQMYYGKRGAHMPDHMGDPSPVLDPFETQARALYDVAKNTSFYDFKHSYIERFMNTFGKYLDVPQDAGNNMIRAFKEGKVNPNVHTNLRRQVERQREAILRMLRHDTEWDQRLRHWNSALTEWIIGSGDNQLRRKIGTAYDLLSNEANPVSFMRRMVFDLKLGMFNIAQFPLQISTSFAAVTLNPKYGMKAFASTYPTWAYVLRSGDPALLDNLASNKLWRDLIGFDDVKEFKEYFKTLRRSGFLEVGSTHQFINDYGPKSTFASMTGSIAEAGRAPFYAAEVINRTMAYRIAWGHVRDANPNLAIDSPEFIEAVAAWAGRYSMNMHDEAGAFWQRGILSIPTQFWSYNARMLEAMLGKDFTKAQKARLILGQYLVAGSAGIPGLEFASEYIKQKYNIEPDINTMFGTLDRGIFDRMLYEVTGIDAKVSERWGTGTWLSDLFKDIFGMSEFNEKSTAEMLGGATFSIVGSGWKSISDAIEYMTYESGNGDSMDLAEGALKNLAQEISSVNNALKAYMVWNYGILQSKKGNIQVSNLPSQQAFATLLGFQPGELDKLEYFSTYNKNRKEAIADAAKVISTWRTEAFMIPDKRIENMKKVNLFVNTLPADIKVEALREAHRFTPSTIYEIQEKNYNKNRLKDNAVRILEEGNED